jgi:hypothetical protein
MFGGNIQFKNEHETVIIQYPCLQLREGEADGG